MVDSPHSQDPAGTILASLASLGNALQLPLLPGLLMLEDFFFLNPPNGYTNVVLTLLRNSFCYDLKFHVYDK